MAKKFKPKKIDGIDIDKDLIKSACKNLALETKRTGHVLPIFFHSGNYVLKDDSLLQIEKEKYDTILCLSVTKWIHLNFGDNGLKQAFQRMYKQLRAGGHLVLEAQPFGGYRRRKKLSPKIFENYMNIKLRPQKFEEYLLSPEIGFKSCRILSAVEGKGFDRPILVFLK